MSNFGDYVRLNAPRGQTVKFRGKGGYESSLERALKVLNTEDTYVIDDISVGSSHSTVYLVGFKEGFNIVMFEETGDLLEPTETVEQCYLRQYGRPIV